MVAISKRRWMLAMICPGLAACVATISGNSGTGSNASDGAGGTQGAPSVLDTVGKMGLRRLSRDEYDNTVRDLFGDTTRPGTRLLPEDKFAPFDNDVTTQAVSGVLIEALETLASDVVGRALADAGQRDIVVGCKP